MKNLIKQIRNWWNNRNPNILKYGYDKTIHQTGEVNIERDPKTKAVVAVWYRCMPLPFTDEITDVARAKDMREMYKTGLIHKIVAVDFEVNNNQWTNKK